jgi:hypothetical protein
LAAPTFQLRDFVREESGKESWETYLFEFAPHFQLHLTHGDVWKNERSRNETMAAIHLTFGAVSVFAAAFFVAFQRHPAALAVFVG